MGGACCKPEAPEFNPDGTEKETQTAEQIVNDPIELRKATKDGDLEQMRILLRRMRKSAINSGAGKAEVPEEELGYTALHYATSNNSLQAVQKLVLYGASPYTKRADGCSALHLALEAGKKKVATYLLDKSGDINLTDKKGCSPFLACMLSGRKSLVNWLRQPEVQGGKINVDLVTKEGVSALLIAAQYAWFDVLQDLLGELKEPTKVLNVRSKTGETVLGWVLKFACTPKLSAEQLLVIVGKLLELGASPLVPSFSEKVPPAALAAATGNLEVYQLLVSKGALPIAKDVLGRHALHYAAAHGRLAVCEAVLTIPQIKPFDPDKQGSTPLHLAAGRGHSEVAQVLLAKAGDATKSLLALNKQGFTVYHLALKAGPTMAAQESAIKIIEKVPADKLSLPTGDKKVKDTPLLLAIRSHADKVVQKLLDSGADVNAANAQGVTPLACCLAGVTAGTQTQDAAILDMLFAKNVQVDGVAESAHPLLAICKNNMSTFAEKAVATLKSKGQLDWNKKDEQGRSPLMLASLHDNRWLVQHLVEEVKIDVNQKSETGATPLMFAAMGASQRAMAYLLNHGADVGAKDAAGASVLSQCLKSDSADVVACAAQLLMMGAEPEACTDIAGETLVHRAVKYGSDDFISLWVKYGGKLGMPATMDLLADHIPGKEAPKEEVLDPIDVRAAAKPQVEQDEEDAEEDDEELKEFMKAQAEAASGPVAEAEEEIARFECYYEGVQEEMARVWLKQGNQWWDEWLEDTDECYLPPDDADYDEDEFVFDDELSILDEDIVLDHMLTQRKKGLKMEPGPVAEGLMDSLSTKMNKVMPVDDSMDLANAGEGLMKNATGMAAKLGDNLEDTAGRLAAGAEKAADKAMDAVNKGVNGAINNLKDKGMSMGMKLFNKQINITDPYYKEETRYQGKPKYTQIDNTLIEDSLLKEYITSVETRAKAINPADEPCLEGAVLRARNIRWWINSLSPEEFPIKAGQWKVIIKRTPAAMEAARKRHVRGPKEKAKARKRTVWFGLPDLPDRPELNRTTPLIYAVRLGRVGCVKAILKTTEGVRSVNVADGWGHTAFEYAMLQLAKDKANTQKQQIVDLLLLKKPELPRGFVPGKGKTRDAWLAQSLRKASVMQPLVLAVVMGDNARLTYMVKKLAGSIDGSWVPAADIPVYLNGQWTKQVGRMDGYLTPIHLAIMTKKVEPLKLCLSLAADINVVGEESARDANSVRWEVLKEISKALKPGEVAKTPAELYQEKWKAAWDKQMADKKARLAKLKEPKKGGALGLLLKVKDFIGSIEIPGLTRPHPWVNPLHLACRYGLAEMAQLLINKGAVPAGTCPLQRKSPLEEALAYARSNFVAANADADRHNFKVVREVMEAVPAMNAECLQKDIEEKQNKLMNMMSDPTQIALAAVAAAAKVVVSIVMAMLKRPIVHHDPAVACAHVLILARAPVKLAEMQTSIFMRDLMDNGTWAWTNISSITDQKWVAEAKSKVEDLSKDKTFGFKQIEETKKPKEYRKLKRKFLNKSDMAYVKMGQQIWFDLYKKEMSTEAKKAQEKAAKAAKEAKESYMKDVEKFGKEVSEMMDELGSLEMSALEDLCNMDVPSLDDMMEDAAEALDGAMDAMEGAMDGLMDAFEGGFDFDDMELPDAGDLVDGAMDAAKMAKKVAGKKGKKAPAKKKVGIPKASAGKKPAAGGAAAAASAALKGRLNQAKAQAMSAAKDAAKEFLSGGDVDLSDMAGDLSNPEELLGDVMDCFNGDLEIDLDGIMEAVEDMKENLNTVLELVGVELEL